jgi:hypothetical protein
MGATICTRWDRAGCDLSVAGTDDEDGDRTGSFAIFRNARSSSLELLCIARTLPYATEHGIADVLLKK